MSTNRPRSVVCLPTYNERENLEAMVRALGEVLDTTRDGVLVIDVSDPAHPVRVGGYDTPGYAVGVTLAGNLAYVADWHGGMLVLESSSPDGATFAFYLRASDGKQAAGEHRPTD